ncbi:MAG: hypothetical protein GY799_21330 [Desulfobulbaceae bacterium]|nr:hypothetical protein [Desulfobulbaceae bacterium]
MEYYIVKESGEAWIYESKEQLLSYLRRMFEFDSRYSPYRPGVSILRRNNKILRNCCHKWGESFQDGYSGDDGNTVVAEFQIHDAYGRIMGAADLAYEAWEYKGPDIPGPAYISRWGAEWQKQRDLWWGLYNRRFKHSGYLRKRRRGIRAERALKFDPDHKPYSRSKWDLELNWGSSRRKPSITWKQVKVKKQWMTKQKRC